MVLLQGNTYLKPVQVLDNNGNVIKANRVVKGEFVFGDLYKYYGDGGEVIWDSESSVFIVPLTEEDTFNLEGAVECQARLVLNDGSVSGSIPEGHYVYTSKSKTRLTEGGAGEESGELLTIKLLKEIGFGGTDNYPDLQNLPSINGVTLIGNKTTEDLGIVSEETDPTVPQHVKNITENNITDWDAKVEQAELDKTNSEVEDIKGVIAEIENKKADIEYVDKQVDDVREVAEGKTKSFTIETLTDLGTLLGIDTSIVANEYTITKTTINYNEQSIQLKQGDLFLIVDTGVPDYWVSVDDMKIYKMETTKVDLTEYVKNTDIATNAKVGLVKGASNFGTQIISDGSIAMVSANKTQITEKANDYRCITPRTLDYAVKVGMTTNQENWTEEEKASARTLINAVSTEDYATSTKGGVVKTSSQYGTGMTQGFIATIKASDAEIGEKSNLYKVITPKNLDYAVKTSITTNTETLTDEEKANAKSWLGVPQFTATQLEDGSYSLTINTEV